MKDRGNLDHALGQFRKATASLAPVGLTSDIVSQLSSFRLPITLPRFFTIISLGAATASIALTLLLVNREEATPPPLYEFTSLEASGLFSP